MFLTYHLYQGIVVQDVRGIIKHQDDTLFRSGLPDTCNWKDLRSIFVDPITFTVFICASIRSVSFLIPGMLLCALLTLQSGRVL